MNFAHFLSFIATFSFVASQSPKYALLGHKVSFNPNINIPPKGMQILWKRNGDKVVEFNGQEERVYGTYGNRVTLDWHSAELDIDDLQYEDTGVYELEIFRSKILSRLQFKLEVLEQVPMPLISCEINVDSRSDPSGQRATLTCSSKITKSPSLTAVEWSSHGLTEPGPNITISLGDEHDDEVHSCTVRNPLTNQTATFTAKECYSRDTGLAVLIPVICLLAVIAAIAAALAVLVCKLKRKACFSKGETEDVEKRPPLLITNVEPERVNRDEWRNSLHNRSTLPSNQPLRHLSQVDELSECLSNMDEEMKFDQNTKRGSGDVEGDLEEREGLLHNRSTLPSSQRLGYLAHLNVKHDSASDHEEEETEKEKEKDADVKSSTENNVCPEAALTFSPSTQNSANTTPNEEDFQHEEFVVSKKDCVDVPDRKSGESDSGLDEEKELDILSEKKDVANLLMTNKEITGKEQKDSGSPADSQQETDKELSEDEIYNQSLSTADQDDTGSNQPLNTNNKHMVSESVNAAPDDEEVETPGCQAVTKSSIKEAEDTEDENKGLEDITCKEEDDVTPKSDDATSVESDTEEDEENSKGDSLNPEHRCDSTTAQEQSPHLSEEDSHHQGVEDLHHDGSGDVEGDLQELHNRSTLPSSQRLGHLTHQNVKHDSVSNHEEEETEKEKEKDTDVKCSTENNVCPEAALTFSPSTQNSANTTPNEEDFQHAEFVVSKNCVDVPDRKSGESDSGLDEEKELDILSEKKDVANLLMTNKEITGKEQKDSGSPADSQQETDKELSEDEIYNQSLSTADQDDTGSNQPLNTNNNIVSESVNAAPDDEEVETPGCQAVTKSSIKEAEDTEDENKGPEDITCKEEDDVTPKSDDAKSVKSETEEDEENSLNPEHRCDSTTAQEQSPHLSEEDSHHQGVEDLHHDGSGDVEGDLEELHNRSTLPSSQRLGYLAHLNVKHDSVSNHEEEETEKEKEKDTDVKSSTENNVCPEAALTFSPSTQNSANTTPNEEDFQHEEFVVSKKDCVDVPDRKSGESDSGLDEEKELDILGEKKDVANLLMTNKEITGKEQKDSGSPADSQQETDKELSEDEIYNQSLSTADQDDTGSNQPLNTNNKHMVSESVNAAPDDEKVETPGCQAVTKSSIKEAEDTEDENKGPEDITCKEEDDVTPKSDDATSVESDTEEDEENSKGELLNPEHRCDSTTAQEQSPHLSEEDSHHQGVEDLHHDVTNGDQEEKQKCSPSEISQHPYSPTLSKQQENNFFSKCLDVQADQESRQNILSNNSTDNGSNKGDAFINNKEVQCGPEEQKSAKENLCENKGGGKQTEAVE